MDRDKIRELIGEMTLEEKASLCSGEDFWHTKAIERLNIPAVMLTDGPHGLRKQDAAADHLGINDSIKAVCFPAGCATAASFDRNIVKRLGEAIGQECQAENIGTILGPAMNIKRSPLCGRNFEYYSEDPYVSSELAAAFVHGVQSKNVGTSPKHFAVNNQEYRRMTSSSDLDERTYREIYLASFEGMVKKEKPWTIMNSYNRINGVYAGENRELLTDILRNEWGFDGYVMTDWGATNDRAAGLDAGCNLEMPGSGGANDAELVEAVRAGRLSEEKLDRSVEEYLSIVFRYVENRDADAVFDYEGDHALARALAEECIVLLKNQDHILPLDETARVAFIGKYAKEPRYQGGGSSHINSFKVESALDMVKEIAEVAYARGFEDQTDTVDDALIREAVETAKNAEVAVIFAGLPDSFESEGYDRKHMRMPECQNRLIEEVAAVQPNTVVVLHNGSPVEMPWLDKVKGVLETYLCGQAVGGAVVNILYGKANPSGRLPESFPVRLEDTPCYLNYGGERDHSVYSEGVYVGYRYYSSKKLPVLFPFGYGLSYTTFFYSNVVLDKSEMADTETLTVSVDVTNTGTAAGKEVVQLYVSPQGGAIRRPVRELKGFEKLALAPGETKTVTFTLGQRAFAYWDTQVHDWMVESGSYEIQIGQSSETILAATAITVHSTRSVPKIFTLNSTLGEILSDPKGMAVLGQMMGQQAAEGAQAMEEGTKNSEAVNSEMMAAMMDGMPLRQLLSFVPGITREALEGIVATLNS